MGSEFMTISEERFCSQSMIFPTAFGGHKNHQCSQSIPGKKRILKMKPTAVRPANSANPVYFWILLLILANTGVICFVALRTLYNSSESEPTTQSETDFLNSLSEYVSCQT